MIGTLGVGGVGEGGGGNGQKYTRRVCGNGGLAECACTGLSEAKGDGVIFYITLFWGCTGITVSICPSIWLCPEDIF